MAVVVVTGSARGIGLGIAAQFAKEGYSVVLNCRQDTEQLNIAIEEIKNITPNVIGVCADISDYTQAENMYLQIKEQFGQIDVLVNNAGSEYFGLFHQMQPAEINQTISNNLSAAMNMSHLVVPDMIKAKRGAIINISSVWGVMGASCEVVYSAAKAGVIGFTKALAKELAPSGVRVNAIACGAFETRMNERLTPEERQAFIDEIPLGRFGNPEEVGDLAVFLASDKASYITGPVIPLDGGL